MKDNNYLSDSPRLFSKLEPKARVSRLKPVVKLNRVSEIWLFLILASSMKKNESAFRLQLSFALIPLATLERDKGRVKVTRHVDEKPAFGDSRKTRRVHKVPTCDYARACRHAGLTLSEGFRVRERAKRGRGTRARCNLIPRARETARRCNGCLTSPPNSPSRIGHADRQSGV